MLQLDKLTSVNLFNSKTSNQDALTTTIHKQLKQNSLYNFWCRSEGIWFSKFVKVAVRLLDEQELLAISQIHHLTTKAQFGVRMSWEYNTKAQSGQMSWCIDISHPGKVFTDKGLLSNTPQILYYQMVDDNQLVITSGKYEETFLLKDDNQRLRELRYDGKLVRRLWENKFLG